MDSDLMHHEIAKVLMAALFGAVLGLEREWSGKSAGIRTMMLVCIGSALFTIVSYKMAGLDPDNRSDVTRIASTIVTGIGFIGAGLIFRSEKSVHGLTTAATVWAVSAIGISLGIGDYSVAGVATVLVWLILVGMHYVEQKLIYIVETREYRVCFRYIEGTKVPEFYDLFDKSFKLKECRVEKGLDTVRYIWTVRASGNRHNIVIQRMMEDKRVIEFYY